MVQTIKIMKKTIYILAMLLAALLAKAQNNNYSLQFDAVDDYVDLGNDTIISPSNNLTVMVWTKANVYENNKLIVAKGSHINLNYRSYLLYAPWLSTQKWQASLHVTGGGELYVESSSVATLNQWTHILFNI